MFSLVDPRSSLPSQLDAGDSSFCSFVWWSVPCVGRDLFSTKQLILLALLALMAMGCVLNAAQSDPAG